MNMKRQGGFTMIELLVVVVILGVLMATAIPLFKTWQQRAYGSEAAIMMKQLLDAEIVYFLEHNKYYPNDDTYSVYQDGTTEPSEDVLNLIKENLNIVIPTGHYLEYSLTGSNLPGKEQFIITISSSRGLDIFKGVSVVTASVDKSGETTYVYPRY
jgi:prepilin-type N-terminal cleavage/methylation domain-containing protein